jgi:excinuclease ABC subunit A
MKTIKKLKETGNTVVIVEHDREVILSADLVLDFGPGAGNNGGRIVAQGTPGEIIKNTDSLTGPYLSGIRSGSKSRNRILGKGLSIKNATSNNLKGFDLEIPSGGIILITGVSGSGKSTLVFDIIHSSWKKGKPNGCSSISGLEKFQKVIPVLQQASFTGSAGVAATYSGIFDPIREVYSRTEDAKKKNLGKSHFSFISKEGRCEYCRGSGKIRISMDFISDVHLICEKCYGKRYKDDVLTCYYNESNIADVLSMSFSEAAVFFHDQKILQEQLWMMEKVGLG